MGTVILRSHDCLQGRLHNDAFTLATSQVSSRRNHPNPNRRRKRSPVAAVHANKHRSSGDRSVEKSPPAAAANLVMGQVKILKRGEKFNPENRQREARVHDLDLFLGSTNRLGPDPVIVQRQVRLPDRKDGIYAGSAFVSSPPPSSVPVPGFLGKNGAATSDLRRLLRLDHE